MSEFITPKGRVSFPHLFEPHGFDGQEKKYSVQLVIPKGTKEVEVFVAAVRARAKELVEAKWPNVVDRPKKPLFALKDGDTWEGNDGNLKKDKYPEYEDAYVFTASSKKRKPGVINAQGQPIMDANEVYPGCYARISFNSFAYDNVNKGVSFGLQNLQKRDDGEPLGGTSSRAEEDFGPVEGDDSKPDGVNETSEEDMFG